MFEVTFSTEGALQNLVTKKFLNKRFSQNLYKHLIQFNLSI